MAVDSAPTFRADVLLLRGGKVGYVHHQCLDLLPVAAWRLVIVAAADVELTQPVGCIMGNKCLGQAGVAREESKTANG